MRLLKSLVLGTSEKGKAELRILPLKSPICLQIATIHTKDIKKYSYLKIYMSWLHMYRWGLVDGTSRCWMGRTCTTSWGLSGELTTWHECVCCISEYSKNHRPRGHTTVMSDRKSYATREEIQCPINVLPLHITLLIYPVYSGDRTHLKAGQSKIVRAMLYCLAFSSNFYLYVTFNKKELNLKYILTLYMNIWTTDRKILSRSKMQ